MPASSTSPDQARGPQPNNNAGQSKPAASKTNPYPLWAPRFWHSMLLTDWGRMLCQQRFRVHPLRWGLAASVSVAAAFNSKMRIAQTALKGHQIRHAPLPTNALFVLGHWRSGTTMLHELMSVDQRFYSPTTFQCFAANHFLLTEPILPRLLWWLLPSRRPMDNMGSSWSHPQEDEFALCAMGCPSPYLRMAFPNAEQEYLDYLDLESLSADQLLQWQEIFCEFLQRLNLNNSDRRLVLKSPTHTGRLGTLVRLLPDAKFIHISRNPYDVVPSTIRLWRTLDEVQGFQLPKHDDLESYIYRAYEKMYAGYQRDSQQLTSDQLIEIRYEDLVRDGVGVLREVYQQLDLGGFDTVEPELRAVLDAKKNYQRNQHSLDASLVANINQHWKAYFQRYDYPMQ